ncbi:hypothetical protein P5W99_38380 [Paraburkholderia sp. A3BS-1L]|uniref:hypothetical protein n=1 Tax=Paraburkholderia sp. A3BS-1L TaxID=3028375 RepID=UPI003DA80375
MLPGIGLPLLKRTLYQAASAAARLYSIMTSAGLNLTTVFGEGTRRVQQVSNGMTIRHLPERAFHASESDDGQKVMNIDLYSP